MLKQLKDVNIAGNISYRIPLLVIILGCISVIISLSILLVVYIKEVSYQFF